MVKHLPGKYFLGFGDLGWMGAVLCASFLGHANSGMSFLRYIQLSNQIPLLFQSGLDGCYLHGTCFSHISHHFTKGKGKEVSHFTDEKTESKDVT